ncbi:hypothetical protein SCD_n00986 [Sulfuricella denitrificans skB26]|uniref:EF-hand domain-containing protein n=1 Tax=Sulfuricella denitrificans (strain DSM 22764 / NBRC 105220 / skB26) TaxID=1163617 RepID=S6A9W6_SULDS|nr:hypothetical protein [Sulfuricella denitrificans]BAN34825.1 hypothetical protein SCD_n00986 [Sulfuricella denitrificans skB26]
MFEGLKQHWVNLLTSGGHLVLLFAGWQIESREAWPIILGLIGAISFFAWIGNQRRSRLILDTPTSRIASAAQGYIELTGRARQAHDIPLLSKLTLLPCVWYRYIIEQERNDDKGYEIVEQGTSDDTILIDDGSGQCFIDPDYAEIITSHKQVWKKDLYRYTEYLLSPLDTLYVIGEFATLGGANSNLDVKEDLNALLTEWKRDKTRLHERFDLNGDGQIDPGEWELVLLAAKREVAKQHGEIRLRDGTHLMHKPKDGRLFLLSNLPEENLARKYVLWGGFHLLTLMGATGGAAYLLGV